MNSLRYWLCESGIHDTKFEIDYETYVKIQRDLTLERTNYRLFSVSDFVNDFDFNSFSCSFDRYIIVDGKTFFEYSEIV